MTCYAVCRACREIQPYNGNVCLPDVCKNCGAGLQVGRIGERARAAYDMADRLVAELVARRQVREGS